MKRLLWIGDACVDSGFARATHYTLRGLDYRLEGDMECTVLGMNYLGDPHPYPYDVYPVWPGKDVLGVGRLEEVVQKVKPDVIVIQNDPWHVPKYMEELAKWAEKIPVVGLIAVDGYNCRGGKVDGETFFERGLNDLSLAIFWTEFGRQQAKLGGYAGPSAVVPLGVDRSIYKPYDRVEARRELNLPIPDDAFLVGNVNRNQPRKRMDLTLFAFREWLSRYKHDDAVLFLHSAPTGDSAVDIPQLVNYLGLRGKVIISIPDVRHGIDEHDLAKLYSAMDVLMSTSQTEGFSLPTIEAMACGTPTLVPELPVFQEWAGTASMLVSCDHNICTFAGINVIGAAPSVCGIVEALELLHKRGANYDILVQAGMLKAAEPRFDWRNIAKAVRETIVNQFWPEEALVG